MFRVVGALASRPTLHHLSQLVLCIPVVFIRFHDSFSLTALVFPAIETVVYHTHRGWGQEGR